MTVNGLVSVWYLWMAPNLNGNPLTVFRERALEVLKCDIVIVRKTIRKRRGINALSVEFNNPTNPSVDNRLEPITFFANIR